MDMGCKRCGVRGLLTRLRTPFKLTINHRDAAG